MYSSEAISAVTSLCSTHHHASLDFITFLNWNVGLPRWLSGKECTPCNAREMRNEGSIPEWGRSAGGGNDSRLPVFLPWKPYGQRSLEGYSLGDHKESDKMEHRGKTGTVSSLDTNSPFACLTPAPSPWHLPMYFLSL